MLFWGAFALASASSFLFCAAVSFFPPGFGVSALSLGSNTAFFFATFDSLSSALARLLAPELVGMSMLLSLLRLCVVGLGPGDVCRVLCGLVWFVGWFESEISW